MIRRKAPLSRPLSRRAQAIIEVAVFGSIIIFIIGSILQQGYSTMEYQQAQLQPMRMALLTSYLATKDMSKTSVKQNPATYKKNSVSIYVVEDRLSPGAAKYGATDRRPSIMAGQGSLSKGLFYPLDWSDVSGVEPWQPNAIGVTDLYVNGRHFALTSAAAYLLRLHRNTATKAVTLSWITSAGLDPCKEGTPMIANEAVRNRLSREWGSFYGQKVPGNPGYTLTDTRDNFDYNRNGIYTDDLWNISPYKGVRSTSALWKWVRVDPNTLADGASSVSVDVNGDLIEDTVYPATGFGVMNKCVNPQSQPPSQPLSESIDFQVLDSNAGDMAGEEPDGFATPNDMPGLKMDSSIYTRLDDGTVMEMRNGSAFIPGTRTLAMSVAKKQQTDYISRVWQLNRKMLNPDNFADRNLEVDESCGDSNVLTPAGYGGCCMTAERLLKTCLDKSSRTLYIRTGIIDNRGWLWMNRIDPDRSKALLGAR